MHIYVYTHTCTHVRCWSQSREQSMHTPSTQLRMHVLHARFLWVHTCTCTPMSADASWLVLLVAHARGCLRLVLVFAELQGALYDGALMRTFTVPSGVRTLSSVHACVCALACRHHLHSWFPNIGVLTLRRCSVKKYSVCTFAHPPREQSVHCCTPLRMNAREQCACVGCLGCDWLGCCTARQQGCRTWT